MESPCPQSEHKMETFDYYWNSYVPSRLSHPLAEFPFEVSECGKLIYGSGQNWY